MGVESGTTVDDFMDFFSRTIRTAIKDKSAGIITDVGVAKPEVASSKDVLAHIQSFLYWSDLKLETEDAISIRQDCARQFIEMGEYRAASMFHRSCMEKVDSVMGDPTTDAPSKTFLTLNKVQSLYGIAKCEIRELLMLDPGVKYPNTLPCRIFWPDGFRAHAPS